jgi:predicted PurR-regulated permease PerM
MPESPPPSQVSTASKDREAVDRAVEIAIRISLLALWAALCFAIMSPFLVPIAWGIIITVAVHPAYVALLKQVGNRRVLASVLFTLIALLVLILPIYLLSDTLVQGAESLAHGFEGGRWIIPPAPDLSYIPLIGNDIQNLWHTASQNIEEALRQIEPQLRQIGQWVLGFAKDAGIGILHFIFAIFIAAGMLAKSEKAGNVAHGIARRLAGEHGSRFAELAIAVVRSVSRGILGVAMIQATLAGLGMLAAGVPAAGLWALVALLLSTIQLGVFPVMLPAAIYLFYTASTTTAVLFLIWTLFVGGIDNVLKPLLLGRGISVPMLVIFVGAIGGFIGQGIIGLFVGAVVLVLGYELLLAWLGEAPPPRDAPDAPPLVERTPPEGDRQEA